MNSGWEMSRANLWDGPSRLQVLAYWKPLLLEHPCTPSFTKVHRSWCQRQTDKQTDSEGRMRSTLLLVLLVLLAMALQASATRHPDVLNHQSLAASKQDQGLLASGKVLS